MDREAQQGAGREISTKELRGGNTLFKEKGKKKMLVRNSVRCQQKSSHILIKQIKTENKQTKTVIINSHKHK